jgi:uncharacterized protein (DUF433 family)
MSEFTRITRNPKVMMGKACIRGKRITVEMILGQLADSVTVDELLRDYPNLEKADIMEAIRYGAWLASGHDVELAEAL